MARPFLVLFHLAVAWSHLKKYGLSSNAEEWKLWAVSLPHLQHVFPWRTICPTYFRFSTHVRAAAPPAFQWLSLPTYEVRRGRLLRQLPFLQLGLGPQLIVSLLSYTFQIPLPSAITSAGLLTDLELYRKFSFWGLDPLIIISFSSGCCYPCPLTVIVGRGRINWQPGASAASCIACFPHFSDARTAVLSLPANQNQFPRQVQQLLLRKWQWPSTQQSPEFWQWEK